MVTPQTSPTGRLFLVRVKMLVYVHCIVHLHMIEVTVDGKMGRGDGLRSGEGCN